MGRGINGWGTPAPAANALAVGRLPEDGTGVTDTAARITRIFYDALSIEVPSPTTDVIEGGLLDSLAFVTLLFEIEQQFAVHLPTVALDIDALRTVERIASLVDGLKQAA
jgi:acyl carrier protein